jgi:hypothetical protein
MMRQLREIPLSALRGRRIVTRVEELRDDDLP